MESDRKNKVLPRANRIIKQSLPLASLSRCGTNSCAGIKTETQQVVVLSDGAIRRSSAFVLLEKRIFAIRSPIGRTKMINGAHASRAIDRVERNGNIGRRIWISRSEEHTSELQSLMRISYAVFCLKKKKK